ncbi:MAG: helix-turn-helix domain-containing protein [Candidatus Binatia bacterium]
MRVATPPAVSGATGEQEDKRQMRAATLAEAIDCFRRTCGSDDPRERMVHQVSEAWMLSDDRSSKLSFAAICDSLGIDPSQVRRILSAWKEGGRAYSRSTARSAAPPAQCGASFPQSSRRR